MNPREIDAKVAKALGWEVWRYKDGGISIRDGQGSWHIAFCPSDPSLTWGPSTDIAAAWQVVEWMAARGWYYGIANRGDGTEAWFGWPGWATESTGMSVLLLQANADTAPLAICRAFLAATGEELGE